MTFFTRGRGRISHLLAALAASVVASPAFAGVGFNTPEVEANESKAAATLVQSAGQGMNPGDTLSGLSSGSLTVAGDFSVDYFRVRTAAATPAIYRYRLSLTTSGAAGHTGTLRGLTQTNGVVNTSSDVPFQTSSAATSPARFNQWYGFGAQEEVYYRVSGTGSTTQPYTATLSRTTVTPINLTTLLLAGPITIDNDPVSGNTADTDLIVYDAAFTPVAGFSNDGQNALTRTFTPGVYYLAVSNFNVANNQPSPSDDAFRAANVLDFPNVVANGNASAIANMNMRFTDSGGSAVGVGSKAGAFDVVWYRFTVVAGGNPTGAGLAAPASVGQGRTTLLTVAVTPGAAPPSTGLAVTVSGASIGIAEPTILFDDGSHGDLTAGDNVFSSLLAIPFAAPLGASSLPFIISDAQSRSGSGAISINIVTPPPLNDECGGAIPIPLGDPGVAFTLSGTTINTVPSFDGTGACGTVSDNRDVYFSLTPSAPGIWIFDTCATPGVDTVVSVHSACPTPSGANLVSSSTCQDGGCGQGATGARTFASLAAGTSYLVRVATKDQVVGDFTLTATSPPSPPANDECSGAISISSFEIAFDASGATNNPALPANPGCAEPVQADVWHLWTPPSVVGNGQWSVFSPASSVRVAVWPATCPVATGTQLACTDGGAPAFFSVQPDTSYLIQIGGTAAAPLAGAGSVVFSFIGNQGVCCTSGSLSLQTEADCQSLQGAYLGDNTSRGVTGPGVIASSPRTNLAIPDNNLSGLTDTIVLEGDGLIENLFVRLRIDHAFVGDLRCTLARSDTTTVTLFDRIGRFDTGSGSASALSSDNQLVFLDPVPGDIWFAASAASTIAAGDYRPSAAGNAPARLSDFVGQPIGGVYTLRLVDAAAGDQGVLVSWSLEVNPPTLCPPPPPVCPTDFNGDGVSDPDDLSDFITGFFTVPPDPRNDFNSDGAIDPDDLSDFITGFFQGCP